MLDERHQDAATAISGSGPAYVALFVDALARAGVRQGLPRDVAQALAVQTLRGHGRRCSSETGQHPAAARRRASRARAARRSLPLEALEAAGSAAVVAAAVAAAVKRAKELGS